MKSIRFVVIFCVGIFLFACGEEAPERPLIGIVIHDHMQNEVLKNTLREKGIRFSVDKREWIWYSLKDRDVVAKIAKEIQRSDRDTGVTFSGDLKKQAVFLKLMDERGIAYSVEVVNNQTWITWALAEDKNVNKLMDEMGMFPKPD